MKKTVKSIKITLLVVLSFALASVAYAVPTTVNFTAHTFIADGPDPAPTDPVTGIVIYDAVGDWSTGSPVLSIDMWINGYQYSAAEVNVGASGDSYIIGGTITGVNGIGWGNTDFWLTFNEATSTPSVFAYSVSGPGNFWSTNTFSHFSVSQVPEPATMLLFGLGLLGLAGLKRQYQK